MILDRDLGTRSGDVALRELIQSLLIGELVHPSPRVWLVSPWLSDTVVVDNSSGGFASVVPEWEERPIRLAETLIALKERGSDVRVVTTNDLRNRLLLERLERGNVRVRIDKLHAKGLLTDAFYLAGSFNFTHNGITRSTESASLTLDPARIGERFLQWREWWGP